MRPSDRIPNDWLLHCVQDSHIAWHRHFPRSLHPTDLRGRLVPEGAQTFGEIMAGNGLVVVEPSGDCVDHGFVGQLAAANANALTMDEKIQSLTTELATMKDELATIAQTNAGFATAMATMTENIAVMSVSAQEWKCARDRDLEERKELQDKVQELSAVVASLKKESILSNKVKKRVALSLAREAVESAIGRVKCDTETWAGYISTLSAAEWTGVGVSRQLVKELLADGALEFNDSIHNILAEEVVGSIPGMHHGSLRTAWEDIFFLAFGKQGQMKCEDRLRVCGGRWDWSAAWCPGSVEDMRLGRSELQVSRLGIGTLQWGDPGSGFGSTFGEAELATAFDEIVAGGINFFDTAEVYGYQNIKSGCSSEQLVGKYLRNSKRQQDVQPVIATKFFTIPWTNFLVGGGFRLGRKSLLAALRESLKRSDSFSIPNIQ